MLLPPARRTASLPAMMLGMIWVLVCWVVILFVALLLGLFIWQGVREWKGKRHDDER